MSLDNALDLFQNFNKEREQEKTKSANDGLKLVPIEKNYPKSKLNLTKEQTEILNAKEDIIKILAYAGCGKTFVLENFAKKNIKKKGLYIAFNKDLKLEAEKRFPESVKCMTMHGLAFARFGKDLVHKLNSPFFPQHVYQVIQPQNEIISDVYARCIYNTVINFTYSKDSYIQKQHIYLDELNILIKSLPNNEHLKNIKVANIIADAEIVWKNMIDQNSNFPTTHDAYLKLMQLAKVQLPYQTILLDEAQDVNPAMLDLFERQNSKKILTGDPYQSIYQFRKAVDAMTISQADKTYYLTQSFRFGQKIADIANTIISLRGETNPLFGQKNIESKINLFSNENHSDILMLREVFLKNKTRAIITRTNAKMFEEAIKYSSLGFDIYFEGGDTRFDLLEDLRNLKNGNLPQDGFLKTYYMNNKNSAFEDLKNFSKENGLTDWYLRCNIVEKYKDELPNAINALNKNLVTQKTDKTVIITNVHKSKGLEYDVVVISDDFNLDFMLMKKTLESKQVIVVKEKEYENVNLLYVALTRAKKELFVQDEVLYHANEVNKKLNNCLLYPKDYGSSQIYLGDDYKQVLEKMKKNIQIHI